MDVLPHDLIVPGCCFEDGLLAVLLDCQDTMEKTAADGTPKTVPTALDMRLTGNKPGTP